MPVGGGVQQLVPNWAGTVLRCGYAPTISDAAIFA